MRGRRGFPPCWSAARPWKKASPLPGKSSPAGRQREQEARSAWAAAQRGEEQKQLLLETLAQRLERQEALLEKRRLGPCPIACGGGSPARCAALWSTRPTPGGAILAPQQLEALRQEERPRRPRCGRRFGPAWLEVKRAKRPPGSNGPAGKRASRAAEGLRRGGCPSARGSQSASQRATRLQPLSWGCKEKLRALEKLSGTPSPPAGNPCASSFPPWPPRERAGT